MGAVTIERSTLPGGTRVVTEAMPGTRSATVGIWVPVGSRDETPAVAGASHFLEHLLFKGTPTRTALDIAQAMDAVGGEFNAFTEKEHTCYYATVLDRDVDLAVDIVTDIVLHALVAPADVEVERNVVLEEIAMRDDDPSDLVHDEFAAALFGDTPLGRPILGTVESISGMGPARVGGYYRGRYDQARMVLAAAGNLDHAALARRAQAAFDAGPFADRPARPRPKTRAATPAVPVSVVEDETEQANLILGTFGLSRHDERRFAAGVLSAALGGGTSSRLFQRVREERGLAYSVYSFTSGYADTGVFGLYAGCTPGKTEEVLALMQQELADIAAGGLTGAEVERGKGQMRGGTVLGLEDSSARMSRIGKSELVYGDVLTLDELIARIDAVTVADVVGVAEQLLTQPRCLTVVGPFGEHDFAGAA